MFGYLLVCVERFVSWAVVLVLVVIKEAVYGGLAELEIKVCQVMFVTEIGACLVN